MIYLFPGCLILEIFPKQFADNVFSLANSQTIQERINQVQFLSRLNLHISLQQSLKTRLGLQCQTLVKYLPFFSTLDNKTQVKSLVVAVDAVVVVVVVVVTKQK